LTVPLLEGYYEYVDGSVGGAGQTGYLMSPVLPSSTQTCLIFYFNIFVSLIFKKILQTTEIKNTERGFTYFFTLSK
jgi:hypothetical protein